METESSKPAVRALGQFYRGEKITVICPKCKKHPIVTVTPKGERTTVRCECGYVFTGEINF